MAKRTKSTGKLKRNKKNNSFTYFLIAVIIIAILSFAITYIVTQAEHEDEVVVTTTNKHSKQDVVNNSKTKMLSEIEGTWASLNDGAMLTISGRDYSLELPNVEGTLVGKGTCLVVGNKITFVDTHGDTDCNISPGVYTFKITSDEITFEMVDDQCKSRYSMLSATWFKV